MNKINSVSHVWSLICSNSLLDQQSNNLSLINTIEKFTITIPKEEMLKVKEKGANGFLFPVNFEIVSRFIKNEVNKATFFDLRIKLINPDEKTVLTSDKKYALEKDKKNLRVRNRFNTFPVSKSGDYFFIVEIKDIDTSRYIEVAMIPLEIVLNISSEKGVTRLKTSLQQKVS